MNRRLSTPPRFKTLEEANRYIIDLHRDLESLLIKPPANTTEYALGTFTERYNLSSALTTAQLQEVVQTLIDNLHKYGTISASRT